MLWNVYIETISKDISMGQRALYNIAGWDVRGLSFI